MDWHKEDRWELPEDRSRGEPGLWLLAARSLAYELWYLKQALVYRNS